MAQQSYLVKILSGSNMGAEIELFSTSILVGDSDDCDIVLGDPFLEHRTFSMEIFEDSVTIKTEGLPFYIDGRSTREAEVTAKFYTVITVGTTSFVIGETEVVWPDITAPETLIDEEEEQEEEALEEEESEEEEELEEEGEAEDEEGGEDENILLGKSKAFVKNRVSKMTFSAGIILIGILCIGAYMIWFWTIRKPEFGSEEYIKNIHILLRSKGYEKLRVGVRNPDLLIISGYVMQKEDIRTIEDLVYNQAPKVSLYIRSLQEVLEALQEYLTLNQVFISVKYSQPNNGVTFTGYLKDEPLQEKLEHEWRNYLPMFSSVQWNIAYWEEIDPVMKKELFAMDLSTALLVTPYDYTIHVSGGLTDPDIKAWEDVKASILGNFSLMEQVITENIDRIRVREDARIRKMDPSPDRVKGVLDDDLLTIMGVRRELNQAKLVDLPLGTNFDEVMSKDPCPYISVIPGEVLFVGINGERGMYSTGSMLPGKLKIIDILEKSIILENTQGTYIFCNTE